MIPNLPGVYEITCVPTGNSYIGSSANIRRRWREHLLWLRKGEHHSRYMQNSWNKYGKSAFKIKALITCEVGEVLWHEQRFIDERKPAFNTCLVAGSALGVKRSEETKRRLSKASRELRAKYEWKGQVLCLTDIAEMEGIDAEMLISRVCGLGHDVERAVNQAPRVRRHILTHEGKTQDVEAWAKELGVHPRRIHYRISEGYTIAGVISRLEREEKAMSLAEFCRMVGCNLQTTKSRIQKGMSVLEAAFTPPRAMDNSWRYKEAE